MEPLISVIIPVYNVEPYLNRCVQSVADQTYKKLEIIMVDDGSPDQCPEICDEWAEKDPRIKVIHKKNGGLSDARNAGLSMASGDYIAFVDSDDWIEPDYIEKLFLALRKIGADLAACEIRTVFDGDESVEVERRPFAEGSVFSPEGAIRTLIQGEKFRAVAWNKLYSRRLLYNEAFEVGRLHEDEFFTYRILDKCKKLTYIDEPLYNYRQRKGSIMTTLSLKHLDALDAYERRLVFLQEKYPDLFKRDKVTYCIACLNYYCAALTGSFEDSVKAQEIILDYRKKIRFSMKELCKYPWKSKLYIIGSSPVFMKPFAKVRNARKN